MTQGADDKETAFAPARQETVVRLTGTGSTWWDHLKRLSPNTFDRITRNIAVTREHNALDPKVRALIYIGVDALVTHLYPSGLAVHAENAFELGASLDEVVEALQIACAVSSRSYEGASEVLHEVLTEAGIAELQCAPAEGNMEFRQRFVDKIGFWDPHMDRVAARAPQYYQGLLDICHSPGEASAIGSKDRALIAASLAAAPPIADFEALRRFARAALKFGASAEELYEAIQMTNGLGGHAFSVGVPIVAKILDEGTT